MSTYNELIWSSVSGKAHSYNDFFFHFFSKFSWAKETIHLNQNSSTPTQMIDLENSMQQSFATLSKLLTFRYICATSEGRGHSSNFALSKIYKIYNLAYEILELYNVVIQIRLTTIKTRCGI